MEVGQLQGFYSNRSHMDSEVSTGGAILVGHLNGPDGVQHAIKFVPVGNIRPNDAYFNTVRKAEFIKQASLLLQHLNVPQGESHSLIVSERGIEVDGAIVELDDVLDGQAITRHNADSKSLYYITPVLCPKVRAVANVMQQLFYTQVPHSGVCDYVIKNSSTIEAQEIPFANSTGTMFIHAVISKDIGKVGDMLSNGSIEGPSSSYYRLKALQYAVANGDKKIIDWICDDLIENDLLDSSDIVEMARTMSANPRVHDQIYADFVDSFLSHLSDRLSIETKPRHEWSYTDQVHRAFLFHFWSLSASEFAKRNHRRYLEN